MEKFLYGLMLGVVLTAFVFASVPSAVSRALSACKDAEVTGVPVVWEQDYPFCSVEVNINGKVKSVSVEEYYEYTK